MGKTFRKASLNFQTNTSRPPAVGWPTRTQDTTSTISAVHQSITEVFLRHIHTTPCTRCHKTRIRCHMYHMYILYVSALHDVGLSIVRKHRINANAYWATSCGRPRNPVDTELQDTPKLHPAPPRTALLL